MLKGALTGYIDVAQMTLYAFFIFFAGIIFYLRREDKREGYPLEADNFPRGKTMKEGFPFIPRPKIFRLTHGGITQAPDRARNFEQPPILAKPVDRWPGSPLQPTGDPMLDGVGPASYALRAEVPELMLDGTPLIVPMRRAAETSVDVEDADPRGMVVVGADRRRAGIVSDIWVDLAEPQIRYLEVSVDAPAAAPLAEGETPLAVAPSSVLLPMGFAQISRKRRQVKVSSILARHFATVPRLANPDQVTKREEDRITAYYSSGHLYAKPSRLGPIL
jgi:photosynthetic reaction center H subunit